MRHLVGGIAVAALLAAGLPAAAQMSTTAHQPPLLSNPPAPRAPKAAPGASGQSGTSTPQAQTGTSTAQQPAPSSAEPVPSATNGGMEGQSTNPQHPATRAKTGKATPGKHMAKRGAHHGTQKMAQNRTNAAQDNMAEQLNRQELQRVEQGSSMPGSGSSAPGGSPATSAPGGAAPQR
jgi:hypothetical protein